MRLSDKPGRRSLGNFCLPGQSEALRALEVTIVVHGDVVPWRYPARRELQFGEWQRKDILAGIFEPATTDVDLAILLTKVRQHSLALAGSAAEDFFNPVPEGDLFKALSDTLKLWNSQPDWEGDERNVVLTLSRIWYSAATGKIAPKDIVANWAMERLPDQHKPVLLEARQAYLGQGEDCLASRADQLAAFVHFVKHEATKLLSAMPVMSNNSFKPTRGLIQALVPLKPSFISPMFIQTAFSFSNAVQRWVCRFSGLRLVALRWFVVFWPLALVQARAAIFRSAVPPRWHRAFRS